MVENTPGIAIYQTHQQAEEAVKELQRAGFDMKTLSIIGKGYHTEDDVVGYYTTGDKMKLWGKTGAFWGGLWGMLFGGAFFLIPGLGPIMLAGPIVTWIVGALEGAVVVGGMGALGAALVNAGVPKDSVLKYETAIKANSFLLLVHGTAVQAERAKQILSKSSVGLSADTQMV
jgi:hypothetical protein